MRALGGYNKPGMATSGTLASANKRRRRAFEMTGPVPPPTHEQIACRAYELFAARGEHDGDALADWFAAESELRERASRAASVGRRVAQPHH